MPEPRIPSRPGPAQGATLIAVVIVILGIGLVFAPYLLTGRQPVTSVADAQTPHAGIEITAFTLPAHQRACMSLVTVTPNSRIAGFQPHPVSVDRLGGQPIDLILSAPGYRTVAHLPGGYLKGELESGERSEAGERSEKAETTEPEGAEVGEERRANRGGRRVRREGRGEHEHGKRITPLQEVSITPPRRSVIATACFINGGNLPVLLDGSSESRLASRSTLTIDGKPVGGTVALSFRAERPQARWTRLGEIFEHASNLTDRLIPVWLIWVIAVAALLAIPTGIVAAFYRGLREDEVVGP